MRVLFVSHSAGMLGAERSLLEIASEARADGHEVFVTMPDEGPLAAELKAAGCITFVLPTYSWLGPHHWFPPLGAARLLQGQRSVRGFRRLIQQTAPDVVVTNTSVVSAAATAAEQIGVPHVWIVRESIGLNSQLRSLISKRWIVRQIFRKSFAVCSVSTFVDQQLFDLLPDPRPTVRVQPNPGGSGSNRAPRPPVNAATSSPFRVILPGFFSWEKGQHRAVLAVRFAKGRSTRPPRLDLIGRGSILYTVFLRALVRLCGVHRDVHFHGWTPDVRPFYARADATIFTSSNEAYGRVLVESLAHGVPVIAIDGGVAREILSSDGGEVVESESGRALGSALAQWASEPASVCTRRRQAASRRAEELSAMPSQYEQLRTTLEDASASKSVAS